MTRHLFSCLAIVAASFVSASPASADTTATAGAVYDTVDAVEVVGGKITITGIISGQTSPSAFIYTILDGTSNGTTTLGGTPAAASRCDRLALLAMTKPGKYQFATVKQLNIVNGNSTFSCKLITITN